LLAVAVVVIHKWVTLTAQVAVRVDTEHLLELAVAVVQQNLL
tara:strand:- start:566 stop:691 length:126 start_codon:yes stop_codon:yes gene_type:complete